uniref:RNA-directed DNA polymerase from mobile element jockey n=1 Tax=Sipha flava TaxID=143950 RepID=A0A2S2Q8Z5_9HEMI
MTNYYDNNQLKPNPNKTQVCCFHLRNRDAKKHLIIEWLGKTLHNTDYPVYLSVTLDRTLTFKEHCSKTKMKVQARNNLLRKLAGSQWGAQPHTMRTTGIALCFSTREYACPVWSQSKHAKNVSVALNDTCRIITGCLRPTPTHKLYLLAGIAPPEIRRRVTTDIEKTKQIKDERHPMFGHEIANTRLKSRKSFMQTAKELHESPQKARLQKWQDELQPEELTQITQQLPMGGHLPWPLWKTLNRLKAGVARTKANMIKWKFNGEDDSCDCGERQTDEHLLLCTMIPTQCTREDLILTNTNAIEVAAYWSQHNI